MSLVVDLPFTFHSFAMLGKSVALGFCHEFKSKDGIVSVNKVAGHRSNTRWVKSCLLAPVMDVVIQSRFSDSPCWESLEQNRSSSKSSFQCGKSAILHVKSELRKMIFQCCIGIELFASIP